MQLLVKDAAKYFNVSEKTIYRWISESGLPAMRINKQYRFNRVELLEWANAHRINVSAPVAQDASGGGALPSLADALGSGGVYYGTGGVDKESVLRNIVERLQLPASIDREFLLSILLERETLGSTAIGDGIAIPHVRNPIVLRVAQPSITLCFLDAPVDFGAMDGKPVAAFFALISPSIRIHLHVLSKLAFALHERVFKETILRQGTREEILAAARHAESSLARIPVPGETI